MAPTKININKNNKEHYDRDRAEDEISRVLYQFQPIPEFVLVGGGGGAKTKSPKLSSSSSSPTNNKNTNISFGTRGTTTKRFSSVRYFRNPNNNATSGDEGGESLGGILKLTYQWDPATLVEFEVTTTKPYRIVCVSNYTGQDSSIREQLNNLCSQLSSQATSSSASGATEIISLSGVLTRLLSSLNSKTAQTNKSSLQQLQQSTATTTLSLQRQVQQATETTRRIWDLQLLLLRCAAIGRERTTFCTPIPHEYRKYGHRSAEAIWNVSENICVAKLLQAQSAAKLTLEEQELIGYLLSLPWGKHCTLENKNGGGTRPSRDFNTIEMTLDLEPDAIGDPSPRFSQLAAERGTTTVYHGTKMECTWSILNCGLWNFSETKFCKHGSLLGKGVYFSTNYKIAYQFAGNSTGSGAGTGNNVSPARSFYKAWRHWSILRVLQLSSNSPSNNILQDYDIICFPVFEAQIISPPPPSSSTSSTIHDDNDNNNSSSSSCTRKDGNYYVVPNSRDIRVTKLHLTFELFKKKSFPFFWFGVILFCILGIRQASLVSTSSSSTTNTIKHHHRYQ